MERIPASERTREKLKAVIEGRVKAAAPLIWSAWQRG
jgi:hypothetical protein